MTPVVVLANYASVLLNTCFQFAPSLMARTCGVTMETLELLLKMNANHIKMEVFSPSEVNTNAGT